MIAPILVFGWGNPARGDDAIGPLFVEYIERLDLEGVECLSDYQLQIEHVLDLAGRRRVLFIDASVWAEAPFVVRVLRPTARIAHGFTHTIDPEALLRIYVDFYGVAPPSCFLLEIRGENFSLGAPCSVAAQRYLAAALDWGINWLK